MQILEDEDDWAMLSERLEEPSPGSEGFTAAIAAELARRTEADESEQVRLDPARVL